ncbi:serine/arginine-rich SC35-like splicing factor SCL33 isoform X3 [Durio zibethinus]|uniref:Serine/arginine-rich SC35-like splicing factor SCL33 isoform X3 n=1 Tax=Durio zibethinus TaxID=66656 RepID=A0A6P6APQ4_DURZI|nr:serine/arginine-rich SC35-like splicing factor SCL33 isoform X3 [Durio zibethinus]
MRGRSYSYSPSPPRDYVRRRRSPSPRGRYGGRGGDPPTSLLVRNLRHDCREPRGFGFVQYLDPADAADAKYHMDGYVLLGRELTVVFAEENRKKPSEMRARERGSGQAYRQSPLQYSRSPRYSQSYAHSPDYYSPLRRQRRYSRSISPRDRRYRGRSYSRSPYGSRSPNQSFSRSRSRSLDYPR